MPADIIEGLKAIAQESKTLVTWSLSIIGGSLLAVLSTSYFKPESVKVKLIYLLFIPGWLCLGISIYYSDEISRRLLAALFSGKAEIISNIGEKINIAFTNQLNFFGWAQVFFGVWLLTYLLWWTFKKS
jgi:hypothetical protein